MKADISKPILVYAPEMNGQVSAWGVYAIPRLWRAKDGEMVIRGETWSDPYSIIGKTLTEERNEGRDDFASKYTDSCSYSNTFVEKVSDDSILVCYNDLRYPDKNGVKTKAAFVRKIKVTRR